MELVLIEESKVVYLTQVHRPAGQLYMPDAVGAFVDRYRFAAFPQTFEDLTKDSFSFGHGLFAEAAIDSCQIFPDGIVVKSRSNTSLVSNFIADLIEWARERFGLFELDLNDRVTFYESYITVRAEYDLLQRFAPLQKVTRILDQSLQSYDYEFRSMPLAIAVESDPSEFPRHRPIKFALERKAGSPFSRNLFFSVSPLRTDDHFAFLQRLEESLKNS